MTTSRHQASWRQGTGITTAFELLIVCPDHPTRTLGHLVVDTDEASVRFGEMFGVDLPGDRRSHGSRDASWLRWREGGEGVEHRERFPCTQRGCRQALLVRTGRLRGIMRAAARPGRNERWTVGVDLVRYLLNDPARVAIFDTQPDESALGMRCRLLLR